MEISKVKKFISTPLTSPAIPHCKYHFYKREHLFIIYKTDKSALEKIVPKPLELFEEPLVRFEIMKMPDSTGLGNYTECGQAIPVKFDNKEGEYLHMMYLDNLEATISGREVGYPKKIAYPKLFVDEDTLIGKLDYGSSKFRVANATMSYKFYPMNKDDALKHITSTNYMLNFHPNYDGTPRIQELVKNHAENVEILEAWTGPARLELFQHVNCPLADLPVREVVGAYHILTNLTLGKCEVIYDYLKDGK